jgi:hypothetical protein
MQSAAGHYRLFLDSFRVEGSGALPDRVEPEMEQHYLSGLFSMARMLQGLPGTGTLLPCGAGGGCGGDASAGGAAGQQDKARCGVCRGWGKGGCWDQRERSRVLSACCWWV